MANTTTKKVKVNGKVVEAINASLSPLTFSGYWADTNGVRIDKISFGSKVRFYIERWQAYNAKLKIYIKSSVKDVPIVEGAIDKLIDGYFTKRELYYEMTLNKLSQYESLRGAQNIELCCDVAKGFGSYGEVREVAKIKLNHSTYDGKFSPNKNEVYINVITPTLRDKEGLLIVFDDTEILFKTHSLCRGSNGNRIKAGGNGDTPTGRAITVYDSNAHNGEYSYGNYGLIYLAGDTGEFLTATQKGRTGIAIHAGHTVGYYGISLKDMGRLMGTYGCIRVYNEEMQKLAKLYTSLKNKGKTIYCYIEDYSGNISDVYDAYNMQVDPKDRSRRVREKVQ